MPVKMAHVFNRVIMRRPAKGNVVNLM